MKAIKTIKVRNWIIEFTSPTAGWLVYDGKTIPSWGCGMLFIVDEFGFRCDYPEAVPKYVREKLASVIEKIQESEGSFQK